MKLIHINIFICIASTSCASGYMCMKQKTLNVLRSISGCYINVLYKRSVVLSFNKKSFNIILRHVQRFNNKQKKIKKMPQSYTATPLTQKMFMFTTDLLK